LTKSENVTAAPVGRHGPIRRRLALTFLAVLTTAGTAAVTVNANAEPTPSDELVKVGVPVRFELTESLPLLYLDVQGGSKENGTAVGVHPDNGGDNQRFTVQRDGGPDGSYTIRPVYSDGQCVGVYMNDTRTEVEARLNDCNGSAEQAFYFDKTTVRAFPDQIHIRSAKRFVEPIGPDDTRYSCLTIFGPKNAPRYPAVTGLCHAGEDGWHVKY
jgi:Ricin-type beta-trefoil lectin domain-like